MVDKKKPLELSKLGFNPIRIKTEEDLLNGLSIFFGKKFNKEEVEVIKISMTFAQILIKGSVGIQAKLRSASTSTNSLTSFINRWQQLKN